jgi:hypothetical protein
LAAKGLFVESAKVVEAGLIEAGIGVALGNLALIDERDDSRSDCSSSSPSSDREYQCCLKVAPVDHPVDPRKPWDVLSRYCMPFCPVPAASTWRPQVSSTVAQRANARG